MADEVAHTDASKDVHESKLYDFTSAPGAAPRSCGIFVPERVKELVLWKDPVISGITFAFFNFFFYLLSYGGYTLLSLMLFLATVHVVVSVLHITILSTYHKFQNSAQEHPAATATQIDATAVTKVVDGVVGEINALLRWYAEIQTCQNAKNSVLGLIALYMAAKIASWFSGMTLIYLAVFLGFTVPKVYQMQQKLIDEKIALAKGKVGEAYGQLYAKLPPQLQAHAPQATSGAGRAGSRKKD